MRSSLRLLTLATVAVAGEPLRQLPAEVLQRTWATERATAHSVTVTDLVARVVHLDDERLAIELQTDTVGVVRCEVLEPVVEQAEALQPRQLVALRGAVVTSSAAPALARCSLTSVGLQPRSPGTRRAEQASVLLDSRERCQGTGCGSDDVQLTLAPARLLRTP